MSGVVKMALISTVTSANQVLLAEELIKFDTNNVRTGCTITHAPGSNTVIITGAGVYKVHLTANIVPTATGVVELQLLRNGDEVDGALASATVVATAVTNVSFETYIKVLPSCPYVDNQAQLQIRTSAGATINKGATLIVDKVA